MGYGDSAPRDGLRVYDLYNKSTKKTLWSTVTSDRWRCFRGKGSKQSRGANGLLAVVASSSALHRVGCQASDADSGMSTTVGGQP